MCSFDGPEAKRLERLALTNQSLEMFSTYGRGSSERTEAKSDECQNKEGTLEDASLLKIVISKNKFGESASLPEGALSWAKFLASPGLINYSKADPEYRRLKVIINTILTACRC